MAKTILDKNLKTKMIACLLKGDLASLPECVHRDKGGLSLKYDELQIEQTEEKLILHYLYKKETACSAFFNLYTAHFWGTVTLMNLVIRLDSGEKVNRIELKFSDSPRIHISLFGEGKEIDKGVMDFTTPGKWHIAGFLGLHPVNLS